MTIRSGGRPRDRRASNARPYDPDAYATETIPEYSEPIPRSRGGGNGGRGGNGLVGFLKFLVFALVLAAIVLGGRPDGPPAGRRRRGHVGRRGQPGRPPAPVRQGHRRGEPRSRADQPVSTEPTQVQFLVEKGDTAKTIAMKLEDEGLHR